MREDLLKRWVKQPPAPPIIKHLRDSEWNAALEQLGPRSRVLDVASESTVTRRIDADSVARLDFSRDASAHAREVIGDKIESYHDTDPDDPGVPFDDDSFDGAICIGPLDWRFLDVEGLIDEVGRVLGPGGRFVFSVPTNRSPYAGGHNTHQRYYSPGDALALVSPGWMVEDRDLLFQYPYHAHHALLKLPAAMQEPFVAAASGLSSVLDGLGRWRDASYIVLATTPFEFERYLESGLDCLFRPADRNGFWDEEEGKIIRALDYRFDAGEPSWTVDDSIQWRYAPFALMGAIRWRDSALADDRYDEQIRRELEYFSEQLAVDDTRREMPSYAHGPLTMAFSVAGEVFDEDRYVDVATELYEYAVDAYDFDHAEDSLLVFGWSYLYDHVGDEALLESISDALSTLSDHLSAEGTFDFANPTARRHQNQMYTLWGLCRGIEATGRTSYLDDAERVLDYTIRHRMRPDGAFIWEDVSLPRRLKRGSEKRVGARPPHWDFLYECHQTFFVNAVEHYYAAGGSKNYDRAAGKAMEWIYRTNALSVDLVDLAGIGVPMRFMTVDDRMDVPDQMYKGSYEIGSYVMALTNLLDGELSG